MKTTEKNEEKLTPLHSFSQNGVTVAAMLDTRAKTKAGDYPVKIRVTFKRERKYYPTGKASNVDAWEKLPNAKGKENVKKREAIHNTFDIVKEIIEGLLSEKNGFLFEDLNKRIGRATTSNVNDTFTAKIESLKNDGRVGSVVFYESTKKNLERFAGENISFASITPEFLGRFEKHLLKEGRNYTTTGMYMRHLRAIVNDAIKAGNIKSAAYPFGAGKYEITTGEGRKLALNLQQIKQVVTFTDGTDTLEHYRDLWFFSYLCNGANFNDILKLKYSDIKDGEICFYRSKTIRTAKVKKEIRAIVTPEMQAIIKRWGNPEKKPGNYIFPYLKGSETPTQQKVVIADVTKRTNKKLKTIGTAIGVKGLSTYSARHSFATVLKRSGANIAFISESLGHASITTTGNYLASFEKSERIKNAANLTNFES